MHDRAAEIARDALRKSPADRAAFLDDACGDDHVLRTQVETFLQLDTDATIASGDASDSAPTSPAPTLETPAPAVRTIGGYRVHERIGEGAMGTVHRAEQSRPRRDVALKILPRELAEDPSFEERFSDAVEFSEDRVVVDGLITTSRGPGTALEFSLALVEQLVSAEAAAGLRAGMLV